AVLQRPQVVLAVRDVLEDRTEAPRPVGAVHVGREADAVAHRDADVALEDDPPAGGLEIGQTPRRGIRSSQRRSANGSPSASTRRCTSTRNASAVAST